jgi:hypothetical protein
MRSKLLITSAAALLAGTMFAMGQGATERKDQVQPGSSQPGMSQPKATQGTQKEHQGAQSGPKGQVAPKGAQNEPSKEQPKGAQREPSKEQPKGAQKEQPGRATTGQAPREEPNHAQGQNQRDRDQNRTQGQTQERNQGQQDRDRVQQGQREGGSSSTSVTLTTEQRTKIRETVLRGSNAPRVTRVDFSISVGTVIPRTVRIVEVPETIIEIHPEWRRFRYFVYNDEIIIVEPDTFKIVAVFNV